MFGFLKGPRIDKAALPETIETRTGGILQLHRRELVAEDGSILAEFASYKSSKIQARLGPPHRGKIDPAKWVVIYDAHVDHLTRHWKDLLAKQPLKINDLFRRYRNPDLDIADLVHRADPPSLVIPMDRPIMMVFEPFPEFPSFNLTLELSQRYRVLSAVFEG